MLAVTQMGTATCIDAPFYSVPFNTLMSNGNDALKPEGALLGIFITTASSQSIIRSVAIVCGVGPAVEWVHCQGLTDANMSA